MPRRVHPTPCIIHPLEDLVKKRPALRRMAFQLALKYANRQVVTEEDLKAMGSALWQALDEETQTAFDAAHTQAGMAILPVIIETEAADVQALPWETLHHPQWGFIGKHPGYTLSRRVRSTPGSPAPLEKGPLRVLLFTSLPDDVDPERGRLNVEEEQAQVQEALTPWIAKGVVKLEMPNDGRFATLKETLRDFEPHVVFLSGHGRFHHQPHTKEPPYGEFLFEGELGDSHPVREGDLAEAFVGMGVQLVVLSACESGKAASDALNNGLTRHLSALGIPHVIGMRESVLDVAGIQFARALSDELARGERVDVALQSARIAIQKPLAGAVPIHREAGPTAARELSLGQWALPLLMAPLPGAPLIDWDFEPQPPRRAQLQRTLDAITMPERFVGRRAELRRLEHKLFRREIRQLLITGPGGQGKTSLAGKLALDLRRRGWRIFAWSASHEQSWRELEFRLELALEDERAKQYDRFRFRLEADQRIQLLLTLLAEQEDGRILLLLDNLESLQDPETLQLQDETGQVWMQAALSVPELTLLVTSRWRMPDWPGEQWPLSRLSYGDFLQIAMQRLPGHFFQDRDRLRRIYDILGGNPRGLVFLAAALSGMRDPADEEAFLQALAQTQTDLQADMAIAAIYGHLSPPAQTLLRRLVVYHAPVPAEGVIKLALDLPQPEKLLARLLDVSLLEAAANPRWDVVEYQLAPQVRDWLHAQGLAEDAAAWRDAAAAYQTYLYRYERRTLTQAIIAHHALRRAGRDEEADRLTLDAIVGPLTRAGFYRTLLHEWLPPVRRSPNPFIRAEALGQTGKLYFHLGDYERALGYLQQSLAISQEIGDKAGLCATLFNMGHIHMQNNQPREAISAWVTVYLIARQINEAQALQALANLAPHLGLPPGLDGWEALAQGMSEQGSTEKVTSESE